MEHKQRLLAAVAAPKKNKEASPWWNFFNNCKDVSDSEDSDDLTSYDISHHDYAHHNDMMCTGSTNIAANSTNGNIILKSTSQAFDSHVPITPVKSIDIGPNEINLNDHDGAAGPPGTQDSSFSSTETEAPSSSSSLPTDDALEASSMESQSVELDDGEIEGDEDCSFTESDNNDSSSLTSNTSSSISMLLPPKNSTDCINHHPVQLLQPVMAHITSYKAVSTGEEHCEDVDDNSTTFNNSEDNFIGNIEILPISPLLSTHQRNIRKTAYNLLKRLGEEESLFDLASVDSEAGEEDYGQELQIESPQQHREVAEEVEGLKRHIGECTNMVMELQESLRNYTNDAISENDIPLKEEIDENNREASNDIIVELHTEISTLTSQLEAATQQTEKDAQHIESLEAQLKAALEESLNHLNKIHEYEKSVKSLNEAVNQSNLYNDEISKELMIVRKENEELTMKVVENETQTEIEGKDVKCTSSSLEREDDAESYVAATSLNGVDNDLSEALSEDNPVVEESTIVDEDDPTADANIDQDETLANLDMIFDQAAPLVLHRPTLQEHIVSCLKLPIRVVSILFSLWVTIIIVRIVLIFSSMLVSDYPFLEDDAFNAPGIY